MTKLLWVAALGLALASCKATPPRACEKMKELCNTELDTCTSARDSVRSNLGVDALDKFDGCYLQSKDCAEANGCVAGAAINGTTEAAKSFFDGMKKELDKKK